MAQLNPNFEIDFSDINSYEQIQLINDTQLAKENLLMHRAYKEPSDDEIIRNHFSSFTFVDFCPKVFLASPKVTSSSPEVILSSVRVETNERQSSFNAPGQNSQQVWDIKNSKAKTYELETFSDLFERINSWLKLNKDWRVVSMQTLIYDCGSRFNHLKSSVHCNYLPQNTRGLRLFLSPSKSRFSGPQKIGCINVVPRRISTSHLSSSPTSSNPAADSSSSTSSDITTNDSNKAEKKVIYETLDQILQRLNELLLTRPIEGRILSVETITLPMVDGYVNTESNFFADTTLNELNQATYSPATTMISGQQEAGAAGGGGAGSSHSAPLQGQTLIDILRVYYEFGPMVCGLVNLIDFIPRFYSPTITTGCCLDGGAELLTSSTPPPPEATIGGESDVICDCEQRMNSKMPATESLTRLIKRSLAWFESERKRILNETIGEYAEKRGGADGNQKPPPASNHNNNNNNNDAGCGVDLKLCNLQVHHKGLLKAQLIQAKQPANVQQLINTRTMAHEKCNLVGLLAKQWQDTLPGCPQCMNINPPPALNTIEQQVQDRLMKSANLIQLAQAYQLKYIRLAYIVPVYNKYAVRSVWPLYQIRTPAGAIDRSVGRQATPTGDDSQQAVAEGRKLAPAAHEPLIEPGELEGESSAGDDLNEEEESEFDGEGEEEEVEEDEEEEEEAEDETSSSGSDDSSLGAPDHRMVKELLKADGREEERVKQAALRLVESTRERHRHHEEAHQASETESSASDATGNENSLIGQLTYRLFAPCQLVNSSSCFAINPVNSNSPLARRGSVDLNGSGLSQDSAETHLLNFNSACPEPGSPAPQLTPSSPGNLMSSFGALFPSLTAHDGPSTSGSGSSSMIQPATEQQQGGSASYRLAMSEFESVEAIRRRMEIYVTTNSMKVVAGETIVVNLSDVLSCLSTAIEQTLVRAPFAQRGPTTWVSVYVLYAAVAEPHQPSQLLAQQKLRELSLISEEEREEDCNVAGFCPESAAGEKADSRRAEPQQVNDSTGTLTTATITRDGSLRVEQSKPMESSSLYNSAYDRTVALPSAPQASTSGAGQELSEFFESQDTFWWYNENSQLIDVKRSGCNSTDNKNLLLYSGRKLAKPARLRLAPGSGKKAKQLGGGGGGGAKRPRKRQEDSQCSIM